MELNKIIFIEDPEKGFEKLIEKTNIWIKRNLHYIKLISAIYGVIEDEEDSETIEYRRTIVIVYTGDPVYNSPDMCDHLHTHEYIDKAATCTLLGTKITVCDECSSILNSEHIPALGHEYPEEWTERKSPTYETPGLEFKKCIRCDHEITREIPILEIELEITTNNINGIVIDKEFSQTLTATIENGVEWMLASGSLPDGIILNENGILSGIATSSGIYTFTIQAMYNNKAVIKEYTVNVANRIFTITFDPQGGSIEETSRNVAEGSLIGELPIPVLENNYFGGWFTDAVNGLRIDENYTVNGNATLYARWGEDENDINFGDAVSAFNMKYEDDRTNYNNNPYTLYNFKSGTNGSTEGKLQLHVGFASEDNNSNNMTNSNKEVILYIKAENTGEAGYFDIGFDCDSYVSGSDSVKITRIENGVRLGADDSPYYDVTVSYDHTAWIGKYNERSSHRFDNSALGHSFGDNSIGTNKDSGYTFTINNIFINSNTYSILEVHFTKH